MKFHFRQSSCPVFEEKPKTLRESVLEDLEKTRFELETAYLGFDYVTDPDLIDCYIYELNSVQMRYKFLLASIKKMEKSVPEA